MSAEVKLPDLGDGVESGDVLSVLVSEGDDVKEEQGLIEIETDKATVEVPSTQAGKVSKIHVSSGQTINVGDPIVTLEGAEAKDEDDTGGDEEPAAEAEQQQQPEEAEQAESDQAEAEASAEEPSEEEAPAPVAEEPPPREEPPKREREEEPAAKQEKAPSRVAAPTRTAPPQRTQAAETDGAGSAVAAGPAIRRFAREVGVNLSSIAGSGPGGRITREDVLRVVRGGGAAPKQAEAAEKAGTSLSEVADQDKYGPIHAEPLTRLRKTVAKNMARSWEEVARLTNFDEADITELESVRQQSKKDYAATGIKLTTMPFLIKAVALSLREHPLMNSSIDLEKERIIYKEYINIGIAVDTDRGLVVLTIKNADQLSIPELAKALGEMAEKARDFKFAVEDTRGGTFTISNLGSIGGIYSTPMVNAPEVGILLCGRSRKLPVVVEDDRIEPRMMMPLSLSYDHRLIDGATAGRFLNEVKEFLEAPSRLLLAP